MGTRASPLARWQAAWVSAELKQFGVQVETVLITTGGDVTSQPIHMSGTQGLFTKEIQRALAEQRIDLAVHSLKDLPTETVEGLVLAAVPQRESVHDVLVSHGADSLETLAAAARVGTGSRRRQAQLLHKRPDLLVADIRGNVETRLQKLDAGDYDAIILAEAGLRRLGLADRITQRLPLDLMLPAIGQGALGLECRADDSTAWDILQQLNDQAAYQAVLAERSLLAELRGGCLAPIGACSRSQDGLLELAGVVLSKDGTQRLFAKSQGPAAAAATLGCEVAQQLLAAGAAQLITEVRED